MKRAISFVVLLVAATLTIRAQEVVQQNVKPVDNALEVVSKLQPVIFNYDKTWAQKLKISDQPQYGFVGTEAKSAAPEVTTVTAKTYPAGKNAQNSATITKVDYEKLIPLLVGSIKEQQAQIDALKREIQTLKAHAAK